MNTRSAVKTTVLMMGALICATTVDARDFRVNSRADGPDTNPGDGICDASGHRTRPSCTLRAAIMESNAYAGKDTILLHSGVYKLEQRGALEDAAQTGDLDITESVEIMGEDPEFTIVDGTGLDRVFHIVNDHVSASFRSMTVTGGDIQTGDSGSGGIDVTGAGCTVSLYKTNLYDNTGSDGKDDGLCMTGGTLKLFRTMVSRSGPGLACGAGASVASVDAGAYTAEAVIASR